MFMKVSKRIINLIAVFWLVFVFSWTAYLHFMKTPGTMYPGWDEFKFLIKSGFISDNGFFQIYNDNSELPEFVVKDDLTPYRSPLSVFHWVVFQVLGFNVFSNFWRVMIFLPCMVCFGFFYLNTGKNGKML